MIATCDLTCLPGCRCGGGTVGGSRQRSGSWRLVTPAREQGTRSQMDSSEPVHFGVTAEQRPVHDGAVPTGLETSCPQCAAPIHFGSAHSLVRVCEFCRSAIVRRGVDLDVVGRVADLVAIDTRLALGVTGKLDERAFTVVGRCQLHQGVARWQEWYVRWEDGWHGWLAEAQGRLIFSKPYALAELCDTPRGLRGAPRLDLARIQPDKPLPLQRLSTYHVDEIGTARLLSAEGELPADSFTPSYRFVDASAEHGAYLTLSYLREGDDPSVFLGREVSYAQAGLGALEPRAEVAASGQALNCPKCAAPLSVRDAGTQTVACASCGGVSAFAQASQSDSKLSLLGTLKQRLKKSQGRPRLALGSRGTLFGARLEVIGWVKRSCVVDGQTYLWDEYLLHGAQGYRWLTEVEGHWVYMEPVSAGRAHQLQRLHSFRHYQRSNPAHYAAVQGEFYFHLDPKDAVDIAEYIAPPYVLSRELTEQEVNWTHGSYLPVRALNSAFQASFKEPAGVGPCQPNPYGPKLKRATRVALFATWVLCVLALALQVLPAHDVTALHLAFETQPAVALSEPFVISNSWLRAVDIEVRAPAPSLQGRVAVDLSLVNKYTGWWSQRGVELGLHPVQNVLVGEVLPGMYVLRAELQADSGMALPVALDVRVTRAHFLWLPVWLGILAFALPSLWLVLRQRSFESKRWQNSDHAG